MSIACHSNIIIYLTWTNSSEPVTILALLELVELIEDMGIGMEDVSWRWQQEWVSWPVWPMLFEQLGLRVEEKRTSRMLTNKITRHPSNQISTAVILFAGGVLPLLQKNKMIRTINTFTCHLTHGGTEGIAIKQHVHCKYIPINPYHNFLSWCWIGTLSWRTRSWYKA